MSYTERARQNKITADKARAFDDMQRQQREQQVYDSGANDAYSDVEMELMRRAEQNAMQNRISDASYKNTFANQDVRGYDTPTLPPQTQVPSSDGLAASVQSGMQDTAYANALYRAQQEGNFSEDNINLLVQEELDKLGGGL